MTGDKKAVRIRPRQMEHLVREMEENPYLHGVQTSSTYTAQDKQRDWETLAMKLNSLGGASKSVQGWQRSWAHKKSKCKERARVYFTELNKTGGGQMDPNFQLDANEERIAAMIGKDAILGLDVEESEALDENQAVPEGTQGVPDGTGDEGVDDTEGDGGISELCRMVEGTAEIATPNRIQPTPQPARSTEPRLRYFRKRVRAKQLIIKNNSANTICDGTIRMAQAFERCAAALERANILQEETAAHNTELLNVKRRKVDALLEIAGAINKI